MRIFALDKGLEADNGVPDTSVCLDISENYSSDNEWKTALQAFCCYFSTFLSNFASVIELLVVRGRVTFKSDSLRDPSAMGGGIGGEAVRDGIS